MTDEELKKQLEAVIRDKTLRREIHVVQYLIPIIKEYACEYAEEVVQKALKSTYEKH